MRNGTWGDHIALQAVCNVLNVNVAIISSQNPNIVELNPVNESSEHCIYVSLLDQLHYVGLDRASDDAPSNKNCDDFN